MSAAPDIREQLRSLSIHKDQRPTAAGDPPTVAGRKKSRKAWYFLAVLILAVFLMLPWSQRKIDSLTPLAMSSAPEIKVVAVTMRRSNDMPPLLTATGKIVSDHQVKVATKVSGQIVALLFEQGDRVKERQVLARIEDINYRARRDQAIAEVRRAKAHLEFQQTNYDRMLRLHETNNAPDIEWADAMRARDEAKAQGDAAQAALDFTQKALNDCEVVAPISGVILTRNVEVGDFVSAEGGRGAQANAEFGTIADMTTLRVEVDISELDIARIKKDLSCTVIPDAYKDRRYKGRVMWLDPGANYSKATVQVKVRIEDPDDYLRVEGSAQVVFHPELQPGETVATGPTLWIPANACLPDESGNAAKVFVVLGGRLKETHITLGKRAGGEVEVLTGLSAGDVIASENLDKLKDGQRIKGGPSRVE